MKIDRQINRTAEPLTVQPLLSSISHCPASFPSAEFSSVEAEKFRSFAHIELRFCHAEEGQITVCCAGSAILLLCFGFFACRADHLSARLAADWSESCPSSLLSFCYTCEHGFESAGKRLQEHGSARAEIQRTHKTIDFIGILCVFHCKKRVVVGDGFEPSNRMEVNNTSICQ
jgi:hypothetical protein